MENRSLTYGVQHKTSPSSSSSSTRKTKVMKPAKKQKLDNSKPVKVVYISNPMRVQVSASEFRALVQELTGQDAELPHPSKFDSHGYDAGYSNQTVVPDADKMEDVDGGYCRTSSQELGAVGSLGVEQSQTDDSEGQFGPFDDVFGPQMLENLPGLLPSSYFLV